VINVMVYLRLIRLWKLRRAAWNTRRESKMLSIEDLTLLQAIRETGSLSRAWAKRLLPCPAVQGSDRFVW